jgi:hypothetical protein
MARKGAMRSQRLICCSRADARKSQTPKIQTSKKLRIKTLNFGKSLKLFELSLGFGVWPLEFFCVIMIGQTA